MKKFAWFLVLAVVVFLGLVVTSIDFNGEDDWRGAYGAETAGAEGAIAPALDRPFARGDAAAFGWSHEVVDDVAPCTVVFWVESDDDAVSEVFVPHVASLVALNPSAVHVVWVSESADDTWLSATAPGDVVVDADGSLAEEFGVRRLPFGMLVNTRGSILRTGFPTEIDEESVARALDDTQRGRRRVSRTLNQIEPILYRDGDDEKVAVRVIPESMKHLMSGRTRFRSSLTKGSASLEQTTLAQIMTSLTGRRDVSVPEEFESTALKVDVWVAGVTLGDNDSASIARNIAYEAVLEALELEAHEERVKVPGFVLRLDGAFKGEYANGHGYGTTVGSSTYEGRNITLQALAVSIASRLDAPVEVDVDSEIEAFDVALEWAPGDEDAIRAALAEELNIRLDAEDVERSVLVVEHRR